MQSLTASPHEAGITWPVVGLWTVDGRAGVVDRLDGPATTTLRTDVLTFTRLAGGRTSDAAGVEVEGDADLGGRVLANLAFMI